MTGPYDPEAGMLGLRRALPYLRLYRGRTFVVKVGGALCGEADAMRDIDDRSEYWIGYARGIRRA